MILCTNLSSNPIYLWWSRPSDDKFSNMLTTASISPFDPKNVISVCTINQLSTFFIVFVRRWLPSRTCVNSCFCRVCLVLIYGSNACWISFHTFSPKQPSCAMEHFKGPVRWDLSTWKQNIWSILRWPCSHTKARCFDLDLKNFFHEITLGIQRLRRKHKRLSSIIGA